MLLKAVVALLCLTGGYALPTTALPPKLCICTMDYTPVCGVDGVTYGNKCAMDCAGITLAHAGECPRPCLCPKIYHPVCGQDGKTYPNSCMLQCQGVQFSQEGPCDTVTTPLPADPVQQEADPGLCICPFIYSPVCGSDGVTYGNMCSLECVSGITKTKDGPCQSQTLQPLLTKAPLAPSN